MSGQDNRDGDYGAYRKESSAGGGESWAGRVQKIDIGDIVVRIALPEDRPKWESVFRESYLYYRPDAGEEELRAVCERNWNKFEDPLDPTTCLMAFDKEGNPAAISYVMRSYDTRYGAPVLQLEGTWTREEYRKQGVGKKVLESVEELVGRNLGAVELRYWTHNQNPHTQNLYPQLQGSQGVSIRTNEEIWVLPLAEGLFDQYFIARGQNLLNLNYPNGSNGNSKYSLREVVLEDRGEWGEIYSRFRQMEGYGVSQGTTDAVWNVLMNRDNRVTAYMVEHKEDGPVGYVVIQEGIKFPRDMHNTTEIESVFLDRKHRSARAVEAIFEQVRTDVTRHDSEERVLRWTLSRDSEMRDVLGRAKITIPHEEAPEALHEISPTFFPFRTFRLAFDARARYAGTIISASPAGEARGR